MKRNWIKLCFFIYILLIWGVRTHPTHPHPLMPTGMQKESYRPVAVAVRLRSTPYVVNCNIFVLYRSWVAESLKVLTYLLNLFISHDKLRYVIRWPNDVICVNDEASTNFKLIYKYGVKSCSTWICRFEGSACLFGLFHMLDAPFSSSHQIW